MSGINLKYGPRFLFLPPPVLGGDVLRGRVAPREADMKRADMRRVEFLYGTEPRLARAATRAAPPAGRRKRRRRRRRRFIRSFLPGF